MKLRNQDEWIFVFQIEFHMNEGKLETGTSYNFQDDTWYHIGVTYETSQLIYYRDGQQVRTVCCCVVVPLEIFDTMRPKSLYLLRHRRQEANVVNEMAPVEFSTFFFFVCFCS